MIIFSDFDGTISTDDMLDKIIDHCMPKDFRLNEEKYIATGIKNYNDVIDVFCKHINLSFDTTIKILDNNNNNKNKNKNVIDIYFKKFYNLCLENNVPFYVVSSGIKKIISHYLPYINLNNIYANDVDIDENNNWKINLFMGEGINKLNIINDIKYKNIKKIYIGDGLSDISVVDNVDTLFVKNNSYLHNYCKINNKKFIIFNNFEEIINILF